MGFLRDVFSGRITEDTFGYSCVILIMLIYFVIALIFFLVLPFYIYVNKVNRETDKKSVVYPITNHFYEMVKKFYCFLGFMLSVAVAGSQIQEPLPVSHTNSSKTELNDPFTVYLIAFRLTAGLSFFCVNAMVQVFQLLIFMLSVLRFLLYFFPPLEAFVKETQELVIQKIEYIYASIILKDISFLLWCLYSIIVNKVSRLEHPPMIYFSVLNILVLVSSFLHIPIMFSVRRFAYLPSSQQNNPQRYILIQLMIFFVFKIISTPLLLWLYLGSTYLFVMFSVVTDIVVTPVVIQVSYLLSNRRNIDILWKDFKIKQFVKILFSCKGMTTVRPVHTADDLTNTRY